MPCRRQPLLDRLDAAQLIPDVAAEVFLDGHKRENGHIKFFRYDLFRININVTVNDPFQL